MEALPRHQCLIYDGSPARYLSRLAGLVRKKLEMNVRCLYLNSPPMVAGMRSYLAAAGVDAEREIGLGNLTLTSSQDHLIDGSFIVERMLSTLENAVGEALNRGHKGLWASGDITWEFGGTNDFSKLLEYEWGLEELFRREPALCGICQYHTDTLPSEAGADALHAHEGFLSMKLFRA
jgi:hypothetical protein